MTSQPSAEFKGELHLNCQKNKLYYFITLLRKFFLYKEKGETFEVFIFYFGRKQKFKKQFYTPQLKDT